MIKMISKSFNNDIPYFFKKSQKNESLFGISDSTISFLSLTNKKSSRDIYSDTKNIQFNELNPEFKQILKQEFLDAIINLKKNLLKKKSKSS
jgi:hypothetical protein